MKIDKHIKYWLNSAEHDLIVAENMFKCGNFDWCLFLGHIVLEKCLKAKFVKENGGQFPLKTHNLVKLATASHLDLKKDDKVFLAEVNAFNLEARYPDYKLQFYKTCTKKFTEDYFCKIKEFRKWLLSQII